MNTQVGELRSGMNRGFKTLTWMMGIGFTPVSLLSILSLGSSNTPPFTPGGAGYGIPPGSPAIVLASCQSRTRLAAWLSLSLSSAPAA